MLYRLRRFIAAHIRAPYKVLVKESSSPDLLKKIKTEYARSAIIGRDVEASFWLDTLGIKDYIILDTNKKGYLTMVEYYRNKKQELLLIAPKEHVILAPRWGHCLAIAPMCMVTDLTTSLHYSLSLFISDLTL